tara:strand:+ start:17 stop:304 length:288 start_codon:yes stop_codon:yes gene_type:complete
MKKYRKAKNFGEMRYETHKRNVNELCWLCGSWDDCNCSVNVGGHIEKSPTIEEQEMASYNSLKKKWRAKYTHENFCTHCSNTFDTVDYINNNQGF